MRSEGVKLDGRTLAGTFAATQTLRPLRDWLVVKVAEWRPSTVLAVVRHGKPVRGEVVATGPGCWPKKYNATRSKTWDSKAFRRCDVKVGDTVTLWGLEYGGADFPQVLIGNELHILCREEDICGIEIEGGMEN